MQNGPTPDQRAQMEAVGTASGLGCAIVATMLVFIGGGIVLDRWLDSSPLLTLIGLALALIGAGYQLYELTLIGRKDRPPGPVGRRMASVTGRRGARRRDGGA